MLFRSVSVEAPAAGYIPVENPNYNQGFAIRKGYIFSSNPLGSFEFYIPLSHIFGFAEYIKVIYRMKHSLTLTRGSDSAALYRNAAAGRRQSRYHQYIVAHASNPDDSGVSDWNAQYYRTEDNTIPLAFRARTREQITVTQTQNFTWRLSVTGGVDSVEKPIWIIIGFQTDRIDTQYPAVFNNLGLKNAYVTLNSERYPMTDIMANFAKNEYMKLYTMLDDLKKD